MENQTTLSRDFDRNVLLLQLLLHALHLSSSIIAAYTCSYKKGFGEGDNSDIVSSPVELAISLLDFIACGDFRRFPEQTNHRAIASCGKLNVIEPDTLPQCFQFQEWIGHGVVSFVSNA